MMRNYVVQSTQQTGDVLLLTLAPKNDLRDHVSFSAGQYAAIGFVRAGRPTPMRCFSIVSSPRAGVLQFAMRVRGAFSRAAAQLQVGDTVRVQGPFGDFNIDPVYDKQIVMLAAGIGITPFMSMLRDMTERQLDTPITLLYSNRSSLSIPFYEELEALRQQNSQLQIRYYSNDATPGDARWMSGNITAQDVRQLARGSYVGSTYFVCGPKGFSDAMQQALRDSGVHPTRIVSESFTQVSSGSILWAGLSLRSLTYGLAAASFVLAGGLIMVLDLSRAVPRLASAQRATDTRQTTTTQQSTPSDDTSDNSNSTTTPDSTTTPTTPSPSQMPSQQYYQPPMSSVS